ncbi:MAG: AMP-binding protein [Thiotrichales bacterium]|nr:AMP-binding protein [Thiotrichales bacterium]
MKWLAKLILKMLFRVEVRGLEHFKKIEAGQESALIVANHVSLLDGPLLATFLTGNITFMIDEKHTHKWYERYLLSFVNFFTVDMHSPFAAKHMIEELKKGNHCMIFPEGRISTTGSLMKIYEGTAMVADHSKAAILPVFIEGAQYSKLSYLDGTHFAFSPRKWFPKITLTVLPPQRIEFPAELKGRQKHHYLKNAIYLLMRDSSFFGQHQPSSLWQALNESVHKYGGKATCVEDFNGVVLSRKKLMLGSQILGNKLHKKLTGQTRVGVLLPNVSGLAATFFALKAYGYVPAMLNFTAGLGPMKSACETAELKTLITSRKFVDVFELGSVIEALSDIVTILYLEDIRADIGLGDKLAALFGNPQKLPGYSQTLEQEAVILFTSGSEGAPKGVVLSNQNVLSNINQISAMVTLLPGEQLFNALPTFHSFGLTAGLLWPILKGAKVYLYPSPLHYGVIPELIYQLNVKVLFGTDTFFSGYAKKAQPYDFYSIRALVAGAEKLRPETRRLYADKFHVPIYEGYGVTETSPVLSVNTPTSFKTGTVGQFVPGVEYRLEAVPGITDGGRLFVKGPNIMKGYLMPDQPGILQPPKDAWHDTGDIVDVDSEGFVSIKGRAKRFAKIGGEMISLTAVESYINNASPEGHHVVVAVADERKGEQLILVTNDESLSRQTVKDAAKAAEVAEIMIPRTVILVEKIPVLGTGKTNYPEVQKIADRHFKAV